MLVLGRVGDGQDDVRARGLPGAGGRRACHQPVVHDRPPLRGRGAGRPPRPLPARLARNEDPALLADYSRRTAVAFVEWPQAATPGCDAEDVVLRIAARARGRRTGARVEANGDAGLVERCGRRWRRGTASDAARVRHVDGAHGRLRGARRRRGLRHRAATRRHGCSARPSTRPSCCRRSPSCWSGPGGTGATSTSIAVGRRPRHLHGPADRRRDRPRRSARRSASPLRPVSSLEALAAGLAGAPGAGRLAAAADRRPARPGVRRPLPARRRRRARAGGRSRSTPSDLCSASRTQPTPLAAGDWALESREDLEAAGVEVPAPGSPVARRQRPACCAGWPRRRAGRRRSRSNPIYVRLPDAEINASARNRLARPKALPGAGARSTIRTLGYTDLPHVIAIERRSFPAPWSLAMFVLELSKPSSICLGAVRRRRAGRLPGLLALPHGLAPDERRGRPGPPPAGHRDRADRAPVRGDRRPASATRSRCGSPTPRRSGCTSRFGFRSAGMRRRYYHDNNEDALIMWRTSGRAVGLAGRWR